MSANVVLSLGSLLVILSLLLSVSTSRKAKNRKGVLFIVPVLCVIVIEGLLMFNPWPVNGYTILIDCLSVSIVATLACGLVLVFTSWKWLPSYVSFLIGAILVFFEFLGR